MGKVRGWVGRLRVLFLFSILLASFTSQTVFFTASRGIYVLQTPSSSALSHHVFIRIPLVVSEACGGNMSSKLLTANLCKSMLMTLLGE